MKKKCLNCSLVNYPDAVASARCQGDLIETDNVAAAPIERKWRFVIRIVTFLCVCLVALLGFYFSLVVSADPLTIEQRYSVRRAIGVLKNKGFARQAFMLENVTVFRGNDNWLNASVAKENAYAATNFPFEIMTLYPDFFTYPIDDTERAAILLHEAEHLKARNEHDAYEFVWTHRKQLGWTKDLYAGSVVWQNIRKQTKDNAPELFVCEKNIYKDCTE